MDVRFLDAASPSDLREVQGVHERAPGFSVLVEGRAPSATAAKDLFAALPPGKTYADKFVLGLYSMTAETGGGTAMIGCADLIRGYPEPDIAFIGLLLFAEAAQGAGYGPRALREIERLAAGWGCRRLRLAVIETNPRAIAFWRREGFAELYRKPSSAHTGDAIVMERVTQKGALRRQALL